MGTTFGSNSWEPVEVPPPTARVEIRGVPVNTTGSDLVKKTSRMVADFVNWILLRRRPGADIYDDEKAGETSDTDLSSGSAERCCEINQRYADGQTPLTFAIRQQNVARLHELLDMPGVDVNYPEYTQFSMYSFVLEPPIIVATKASKLDIIGELIEAGADVNAVDSFGYSALHYAAEGGDEDSVQLLLQHKPRLQYPAHLKDPLHKACRQGHLGVVKMLIEAGSHPDPEKASSDILSPLKLAIDNHQEDIAILLLQNGARFERTNADIPPQSTCPPVFLQACGVGCSKIVRFLVTAGVDVNMTSRFNLSAFSYAMCAGELARIAREGKAYMPGDLFLDNVYIQFRHIFRNSVSVINILCEAGAFTWDRQRSSVACQALDVWNIPACLTLLKHGTRRHCYLNDATKNSYIHAIRKLYIIDYNLCLKLYSLLDHREHCLLQGIQSSTPNIDSRSERHSDEIEANTSDRSTEVSTSNLFEFPSLKQCCRCIIRDSVAKQQFKNRCSIIPLLRSLPLPRALLDYLCFSNIDVESIDLDLSVPYLDHMISLVR